MVSVQDLHFAYRKKKVFTGLSLQLQPGYIYGLSDDAVYVNLFISSNAKFQVKNNEVSIQQKTEYPWKGNIELVVNSTSAAEFPLYVRIPGWAVGKENPFDLYTSTVTTKPVLNVNGKAVNLQKELPRNLVR